MGIANQADGGERSSFQLGEGPFGLELREDFLASPIPLILPDEECPKSFVVSATFKSLSQPRSRDIRLAIVLIVDVNLPQFLEPHRQCVIERFLRLIDYVNSSIVIVFFLVL